MNAQPRRWRRQSRLLSNSTSMHWLQDKMASEGDGKGKPCQRGRASSLWECLGWTGGQARRHHPNSPYWPHVLCFTTVQWRPATRNQKGRRSKGKPERQTDREKERRRQGGKEGGETGDCGINSDVKKYQMTVLKTSPHQNETNKNPQPNNNNNKKQIMGENVFLCKYLMIWLL